MIPPSCAPRIRYKRKPRPTAAAMRRLSHDDFHKSQVLIALDIKRAFPTLFYKNGNPKPLKTLPAAKF